MSEGHRIVRRRHPIDIERLAESVRDSLALAPTDKVKMATLLELVLPDVVPGYEFHVVPNSSMGKAEAMTQIDKPIIRFTNRTYQDLLAGVPRARFTAAHELGHLIMHCGAAVALARTEVRDWRDDPEWQANAFAAAFLMPRAVFRKMKSVDQAMEAFGVGVHAAVVRAEKLRHALTLSKKTGGRSLTCPP